MNGRHWFLVSPKGLLFRRVDGALAVLTDADGAAFGLDTLEPHALGDWQGAPAWAAALDDDVELPEGIEVVPLRRLYTQIHEELFMLSARAAQIVAWLKEHRYCGRCGTATALMASERCLQCPSCAHTMYPRITPAIIVLVRRGDRALLAHGARIPGNIYTTLAGFVELGETLEQAVAREVLEEVGLRVRSVRYFGSQPWPFPNSLMVGFTAEAPEGDITPDGVEILDANWYDAHALPDLPPPISIARRLIDAWIHEVTTAAPLTPR